MSTARALGQVPTRRAPYCHGEPPLFNPPCAPCLPCTQPLLRRACEWGEGGVIVSWSHDDLVRLWDGTVFEQEDADAGGETQAGVDTKDLVRRQGEAVMDMEGGGDEDEDEWEDMEDTDEEEDGKPYGMKTESEKFFEDL